MVQKILLISLWLGTCLSAEAQVTKQSFIYATKDTQTLSLDFYGRKGDTLVKKPCVLFVFGGAFVGGRRDDTNYIRYFNSLAEQGFKVASISYRLGLKGVTDLSVIHTKPLQKAIDMAVDDVYDATNWILKHADSLQVDPHKIILSGSSSGAITVLQAELIKCNQQTRKLPQQFSYAGVIAFSGAIFSYKGKPAYKTSPAPSLFFHGTADKIVPYKSIRLFNKGLFGSSSLADIYKTNGYPYYIYRAKNLGHEVSVIPMITQLPLILDFIDRFVIKEQNLEIDTEVNDPSEKPILTISAGALFKKLANQ
ncbi:alpha/beta hydrolase fold domain-containing protein [Flavitalea sp.]|nr:alpha/beta hydrolase fold domain-containing protein [Flavitalea sp.]